MEAGEIGEGAAILSTLLLYRTRVRPRVREELARWRIEANGIPDPELRAAALAALSEKAANPEATAVFACLAPRRGRAAVVRASVAFQVAVDYLDTLGERPVGDALADGLALHGALVDALSPAAPKHDWFGERAGGDGGYLEWLVDAVRAVATALPSGAAVLPVTARAAERCGQGQSRTHAAATGDPAALQKWAAGLRAPPGFEWWELAAGGASSVACHALLALAATPEATAAAAELVDAAYFPSVGALTVLLDDLVDREGDRRRGEHNFLDHYSSATQVAERLAAIVAAARAATAPLPRSDRHRAILAGILAFYLGPSSGDLETEAARAAALARASAPTRALAHALRLSA